jgi:hypothetical protein
MRSPLSDWNVHFTALRKDVPQAKNVFSANYASLHESDWDLHSIREIRGRLDKLSS